jgi:hypothetical protein
VKKNRKQGDSKMNVQKELKTGCFRNECAKKTRKQGDSKMNLQKD